MPLTHEQIEIVTKKLFKVMDGSIHAHFAMARWLSDIGLLDPISSQADIDNYNTTVEELVMEDKSE